MVLEKGLLEAEGAATAWGELQELLELLAAMRAAGVCVPPSSELHQGSRPVATGIHWEFQVCLWAQDRIINKIAGRQYSNKYSSFAFLSSTWNCV